MLLQIFWLAPQSHMTILPHPDWIKIQHKITLFQNKFFKIGSWTPHFPQTLTNDWQTIWVNSTRVFSNQKLQLARNTLSSLNLSKSMSRKFIS